MAFPLGRRTYKSQRHRPLRIVLARAPRQTAARLICNVGRKMRIRLKAASVEDVRSIVQLRAVVAEKLTADYGAGPWSRASSEKGVLFDMRNSTVFVARDDKEVIATLRLTTKKPWAIDRSYFASSHRPLYLLSMAVSPKLQRQGVGRECLKRVREVAERWPADALRLDAYDAPAGAGAFYAKCGFREVGRTSYRGVPLIYYELLLESNHHPRETPNKALATSGTVTPRAGAGVGPIPPMADR